MRNSRLDTPNLPSEHHEHAHSPTFAAVLSSAYVHLAEGLFEEAERLVVPYRAWPMSLTQRLRQLYILAASAQSRHDYTQAIALYEEAFSLCSVLEARAEFAQLSLLCAEAYHNLQQFAHAAFVASQGLSAWLDLAPDGDPRGAALEIDLRDRYSVELFLLGRYQESLKQCYRAHTLASALPAAKSTALRVAGLDWTIAMLHRWRGNTKLALQHILAASAIYEKFGSADEFARLRIVIADIALDTLAPPGTGLVHHYREDIVQLARDHINQALGAITHDPAAQCMALLAQTRLHRMLSLMNQNRITHLESIGQIAEQLHDLPLLAQVYTALGDEFGAMGRAEIESQLNCYRRAIGVVEASQAPAYSVWPRRGLLRYQEFQMDAEEAL
jgi:tetratricopeptide (TPR) repeat protein